MVIARKTLIPILSFFAVALAAGLIFFAVSQSRSLKAQETQRLQGLNKNLEQEIYRMGELAKILAQQAATNPEVQAAFASGDRSRLSELTETPFLSIKDQYQLSQCQFTVPPANVFLRVLEPKIFNQDLSAFRKSLVAANRERQAVSGLEFGEDGLAVRGIVPVSHEGSFIGSTEFSIRMDERTLRDLKARFGGEWSLLLDRQSMQAAEFRSEAELKPGPLANLSFQATTLTNPVFAPAQAYEQAFEGNLPISYISQNGQQVAMLTVPLRDFSGDVVGIIDISIDRAESLAALRSRLLFAGLLGILSLFLVGAAVNAVLRTSLRPVQALAESAAAAASGNLGSEHLSPTIPQEMKAPQDEIEKLARSFRTMNDQIRDLTESLEIKVVERTDVLEKRTQKLQAVSEIARNLFAILDLDPLLKTAADSLRERFGYDQVGLFLLDDAGENLVLKASAGAPGVKLVEPGYTLPAGVLDQDAGMKLPSTEPTINEPIIQNTGSRPNSVLPAEGFSELSLPLKMDGRSIGALVVQSLATSAFDAGEQRILQIFTEQLAAAIQNARLFMQLNQTVQELERTYSSYTQSSWQNYLRRRQSPPGYSFYSQSGQESQSPDRERFDLLEVSSSANLRPEALEALQKGQTIVWESNPATQAGTTLNLELDEHGEMSALAVPIRLREQVIGVLNLRFAAPAVAAEMISMAEEIASRLGPVLESTRLLHEAQRLGWREQQINLISSQVRSSVNLENILQNTVRELGRSLGATRAFIQIGTEAGGADLRKDQTHANPETHTAGTGAADPRTGAGDHGPNGRTAYPANPSQEEDAP